MVPSAGRIVKYKLNASDAGGINGRRGDAHVKNAGSLESGFVVHVGNPVSEGDEFPMVIVKVWSPYEGGPGNGQVLLDGADTLWVTSRTEGELPGQWEPFPKV